MHVGMLISQFSQQNLRNGQLADLLRIRLVHERDQRQNHLVIIQSSVSEASWIERAPGSKSCGNARNASFHDVASTRTRCSVHTSIY